MTPATTIRELAAKLAALHFTQAKVQLLSDIADALVKPVVVQSQSQDPIFGDPRFHDYFSNVLLLHHATNDDKFKKKAFEFAFRGACLKLGYEARITTNPMNPGADVTVGTSRFSLKTESGKTISRQNITISKLMEARWIRNMADEPAMGPEDARKVVHHHNQYDRIIILRAFDVRSGQLRTAAQYELWEIPKKLLLLVGRLRESEFSSPTPNNSFAAPVKIVDSVTGIPSGAFNFRMDGSVEKVTIGGLAVSRCIHQATWTVPVDLKVGADDD
jgi:hypothetical protein